MNAALEMEEMEMTSRKERQESRQEEKGEGGQWKGFVISASQIWKASGVC